MLLSQEVKNLMGQKVDYCRLAPSDGENSSMIVKGKGAIVGIIVGTAGRIQALVKDIDSSINKAYTIELMCIDATEEDAQSYFEHHMKQKVIVEAHNKRAEEDISSTNKEIDEANALFLGQPVQL